ncbi:hypothetical protein Tco_1436942 [Tanacetum coccineum]
MKSIKEGPFQMGTVSNVITGGTEGAVQQGLVRARVLKDLSALKKEKNRESQLYIEIEHFRQIKGETIQGYYLRQCKEQSNGSDGKFKVQESVDDTMRLSSRKTILQRNNQSIVSCGEAGYNVDDDVDDSQENDLALNVDHIFEADECDAFDSDVDEGPTSQTMFMANLTSEDPNNDESVPHTTSK